MIPNRNRIIMIIFVIFLSVISILNILTPDKEFSESENRRLIKFPELSWKTISSGAFSKKFEEYIKDQFVFKDFWVGIKSDVERLRLNSKNNGIFFGTDGYLFEDYQKPGKVLDNNIASINYFKNKLPNLSVYFLLAPNSIKIYEDKLPLFASSADQLETIKKVKKNIKKEINFVNIYDSLFTKKDEYIYFKTDHHWTMKGAYYAYEKLAEVLGIEPYKLDEFTLKIVSDSFYGTYYSKANNRKIRPDYLEVFVPKFNVNYEVYFSDKNKSSDSLYDEKHLATKDKYAVFLGGNHPLVKIKTSVKNNKKIVIFKDSYAHSFIPFLANHYAEIHILDLRYYKLNVYEYLMKHQIEEALFLFNVQTFSTDNNLRLLNH